MLNSTGFQAFTLFNEKNGFDYLYFNELDTAACVCMCLHVIRILRAGVNEYCCLFDELLSSDHV